MPAVTETPRVRFVLITALTAVVPLMICMMIAILSVTQTTKASMEILEAVGRLAGGAEETRETREIGETVKRFQHELMAVSAQTRLIMIATGGISIVVALLMAFMVARMLGARGMAGGRTGPMAPEEVARVLEGVAAEVRAGRIDTHLI